MEEIKVNIKSDHISVLAPSLSFSVLNLLNQHDRYLTIIMMMIIIIPLIDNFNQHYSPSNLVYRLDKIHVLSITHRTWEVTTMDTRDIRFLRGRRKRFLSLST